MAKGWKPILQDQDEMRKSSHDAMRKISHGAILNRSSSAELLNRLNAGADNILHKFSLESRFSPDASPEDNKISLRKELDRELDSRHSYVKNTRAFRKSRSASSLFQSDWSLAEDLASIGAGTVTVSRMPQDPVIVKKKAARRMTFDEIKNKPLPKIASL